MIIHSDSTSAISRAGQSGSGPGQQRARTIQGMVAHLPYQYQIAEITWVKGHAGTPGNEKADALAGMAVGRSSWSPFTSLAHLKLRISETFQGSKKEWDRDPTTMERRRSRHPPPPKKKKKKKKVMYGSGQECHRSNGRPDQDRSLALCGIFQKSPKKEG
jgi:hypothetical protein